MSKVFYIIIYIKIFKIQHLFCTYSPSQFKLAIFQMLHSHMWLVDFIVDSICLESNPCTLQMRKQRFREVK